MALILTDGHFFEEDFPILSDSEEEQITREAVPDSVGILPLRNTVLFPGVVIPITVGRDKSIRLVRDAYNTESKLIGVTTQYNVEIEDPTEEDLYRVGTIARILKMIRMPDGSITIVIQGRSRISIDEFIQADPYFRAHISKKPEQEPGKKEAQALMRSLKMEANRIIEISPNIPTEAKIALQNINSLSFLVHFISSNLNLEVPDKQKILEISSLLDKGEVVLEYLGKELAVLELSEEIQSRVRSDLDKQQREYYLRQQIKAIQDELGEGGDLNDIDEMRKRAEEKSWPESVQAVFDKEVNKLSRLQPNMPDYSVVMNYLEWLLDLPWGEYGEDNFEFKNVRKVLDNDHYGLGKVKDRILEYLAVLKLKTDKKAPILCFYGPPGVGKTSLGKSIAKAIGRKFLRISLGGVRDEAEIRGHRRTYIGAMPGRIIQGMKKAKTGNPVFMLDEIDKVGNDFRGDPSSALLEVLDPEQNNTFQDHFLEVEYDLSPVMFIATANTLDTIHPALRDRMEIIEINGYSLEEKMEIAKRHLVPDLKKEHGLAPAQLRISDAALKTMIDGYTRESGVRNLAQKISAVCRVTAKQVVIDEKDKVRVTAQNVEKFLGVKRFDTEVYHKVESPGVAIGLAWTPVGGDILFIESTLIRGSGKLSMTGQLGDVMKESATLAYNFLRSNATQYGIPLEVFKHWDVHIHFPAGAIPKDGPSAGITILSAMTSLFTQKLVKPHMAMTGEITLRGKVLPVGGIKEKVLAARRAGMTTIIMCKDNKKDVSEIPDEYLKELTFIYVDRMEEVLKHSLEKKKVKNPIDLMLPEQERRLLEQSKSSSITGMA